MANAAPLAAGQEFGPLRLSLDPTTVKGYIAAVEDASALYQETPLVPPMAVVALGLQAVFQCISLPPGTVHLAQEHVSHRAVSLGEHLTCRGKVAQHSQRRDGAIAVLEFTLAGPDGKTVLEGRTTIMTPKKGQ
ncbi:MAG: MaoC family dehydratase N-terminal domain-containing protein [Chloroflexi bacterium]|nr:MaoC family dehydratase N-terminal domain-containing protein [Chloroflexota bacterium]